MSNELASLQVCVGDKSVCVRIAGRANFHSSVDFKKLVTSLWQQGYTCFIIDLTECQLMDSTFLGVMAGLGLKFSAERNGNGQARIELLNPNSRVTDLLENLGINHLFTVVRGSAPAAPEVSVGGQAAGTDKKEVSRTCLEAHKTLMEVNPDNVPKFKDVARFLEEDLKRN